MNRERTCIGCMQRVAADAASDLVRLVVTTDGIIVVDLDRSLHGRGLYVHIRPDCLTRALGRGLARATRGAARAIHSDAGFVALTLETFARAIRVAFEQRIHDILHTAFRTRCAMPCCPTGDQSHTNNIKLVVIAHDASRLIVDGFQREISQGRVLLWGTQRLFTWLCKGASTIAITSDKLADALKAAGASIDTCAYVERSAVAVTRAGGGNRTKPRTQGKRAIELDEKENVDQLGTDDGGGSGKLERVA